jgi:hypothetical protein
MTDELLKWCAANKNIFDFGFTCSWVYKKDANISDYNPAKPSLWESTANQDKMVDSKKLAERYKDNP